MNKWINLLSVQLQPVRVVQPIGWQLPAAPAARANPEVPLHHREADYQPAHRAPDVCTSGGETDPGGTQSGGLFRLAKTSLRFKEKGGEKRTRFSVSISIYSVQCPSILVVWHTGYWDIRSINYKHLWMVSFVLLYGELCCSTVRKWFQMYHDMWFPREMCFSPVNFQ